MNLLELFGNNNPNKSVVDFSSIISFNNIEQIYIVARRHLFSKEFQFHSDIKFEMNGDTFEKRIEGSSLQDVFIKTYEFCKNL